MLTITAYDWDDARARTKAIGETLTIDGELFAVIESRPPDLRSTGILLQAVVNFMSALRRLCRFLS